MKLVSGERFRLSDENKYIRMVSGRLEVYAVTRKKVSFRQIFLMELKAGEAAFPSMDEFEQIDIQVYAVDDSELEEVSFGDTDDRTLLPLMRNWFRMLLDQSWLRLLADRGDEVLQKWENGSVLSETAGSHSELIEDFIDNEGIFSMLLGLRFTSQDEQLS